MQFTGNINYSKWNDSPFDIMLATGVIERLSKMNQHYSFQFKRPVSDSFLNLINTVCRATEKYTKVLSYSSNNALITIDDELSFFTIIDIDSSNTIPWDVADRNISICGYGTMDIITKVYRYIDKNIIKNTVPEVIWEYLQGTDRKSKNIHIAKPKPIFNEFYPWLSDVNDYYEQYKNSESSILVLLGEPGTAKSSFIRNFIWKHGMNSMFTYDMNLLKSDSMFVDFITGDKDLLIVEDADIFLTDREHAGNEVMAKFLNISDGLASGNKKKKIIFTANIVEISKIDKALLRPGRCFDCQVFRRLTSSEARLAAKVAGLSKTNFDKLDYSLAELFSEAKGEKTTIVNKFGFAR